MSSSTASPSTASSTTPFYVLITGASRGLGLGFVKTYASRPTTHVIATCRNPSSSTLLQTFVKENKNNNVTILPLDVMEEKSIETLVTLLTTSSPSSPALPIPHLNLLINNAGLASSNHPSERIHNCQMEEMMKLYKMNTVAPMLVTRALLPLLKTPSSSPFHLVSFVSSNLGSIANNEWGGLPSYRCSKAALNQLVKIFSFDENNSKGTIKINYISMHPGWVDTDMGSTGGRKPPLKVEESVGGMVTQFDNMKDSLNGKFIDWKGEEVPY